MFKISHTLPVTTETYSTPTFILNTNNKYQLFLQLKKDNNNNQLINLKLQELIDDLYSTIREIEYIDAIILQKTQEQLTFLRDNYPLSYTSYAKSCSSLTDLLFSNNELEFLDAQVSDLYNKLLSGEEITVYSQSLVDDLTITLNQYIEEINLKIDMIENNSVLIIEKLSTITDYRKDNFKTIVENKLLYCESLLNYEN